VDVTKAPPLPVAGLGGRSPAEPGLAADSPAGPVPVDRVDIRPLDTAAALQILVAEAGLELQLPVDASNPQSPTEAALSLVRMLLQASPQDGELPTWVADAASAEIALQTAIERAVGAVVQWREISPLVVEAARQAQALVAKQLDDDPPSVLWLRPEWMALKPTMERYWRRRRRGRRPLTDPDWHAPVCGDRDCDSGGSDGGRGDESPGNS
jgi:hypothetical protein